LNSQSLKKANVETDEDSEEQEEEPEEFKNLDPQVKEYFILSKSLRMMLLGTLVVLIFSDPMVDILNDMGTVLQVDAF